MAKLDPEPAKPDSPKLGAGHLKAMGRLGAHELTQILPAFPDSNVKAIEEPGVFGNTTPQLVTDQMGYNPSEYVRPAKTQERGISR